MKTILVLEDVPSNMQAFCAVMSSMGYRVLEATTGNESLETSNNFRQLPSGSVDFIEKPFRASALQTKVESLVNSHSPVSDTRR